ncbi:hypothetical protein QUF72_10645 [Desulfobacterales bacterium HSG2]|nr:hypothetical protein [Desulfobacterales bacterium HSG2]
MKSVTGQKFCEILGKKRLESVADSRKSPYLRQSRQRCAVICASSRKHTASVRYSPDGRYIISPSRDEILKKWDKETGGRLRTIRNIPGLLIQGTDMRNLHPDSEISDEEREILRQYGALV